MHGRDFTALFGDALNDAAARAIRPRNEIRFTFDQWIEGIKAGAIGKQYGNSHQSWKYVARTDTFSQVSSHTTREENISIEKMSRRFNTVNRKLWLIPDVSNTLLPANRKLLPFNTWVEQMREGGIGRQSGNPTQEWKYQLEIDRFTDGNRQTYNEASLAKVLGDRRTYWVEGRTTTPTENKRKGMYKYGLNKNKDLDYYRRSYSRQFSELEPIYNGSRTINYESLITEKNSRIKVNLGTRDFFMYKEDLVLLESPIDEDMRWSNIRQRTLQFNGDYLLEQIRTRYAFFDRPTNGLSNIIIDNYAPKLIYNTKFNARSLSDINLPKTIYAISPWFAQYFGAQQVPTEQLCRILGYNVKTLKQMITKVKHKGYSISFVGYGGTNVNTIHWLTEIMRITQSVNLFKFIEIYEPDTVEISNLLRFPKNPYLENNQITNTRHYISNTSKLKLLEPAELTLLSKEKPVISTSRVDGNNLPYDSKGTFYKHQNRRSLPKDNHIFYGAPNIETRASFEDVGHFISATHSGNDAHLWLNPTQDTDLQVESYGLIQLTPFFMNQLRLAIGLLEILCADDIDFKAKDQCLLEYSFDGIPKLPTNKTYNFQLGAHSGTVATEAEAATNW